MMRATEATQRGLALGAAWWRFAPIGALGAAMLIRAVWILTPPTPWDSISHRAGLSTLFLVASLLALATFASAPWFVWPVPVAELASILAYGVYAVTAIHEFGIESVQGVIADQALIVVLVAFMWDDVHARAGAPRGP